jgi:hypothetical protein
VGNDEAHKPFVLRKDDFEWFCKTAHKPCDVVVMCILFEAYMLTLHSINNQVKSIFTFLIFLRAPSKIEKQANGEFLYIFF